MVTRNIQTVSQQNCKLFRNSNLIGHTGFMLVVLLCKLKVNDNRTAKKHIASSSSVYSCWCAFDVHLIGNQITTRLHLHNMHFKKKLEVKIWRFNLQKFIFEMEICEKMLSSKRSLFYFLEDIYRIYFP